MKTIFGPVPSRRLGRSLGIDVIPLKTCSYDCVYCESGRTTHLTLKRQYFVEPDQVLHDLKEYFREHPGGADVLTFSSGGEPTLYLGLGELIKEIKKHFKDLPLTVLTNGSLLWDSQVRHDLLLADRVVPSLDAVTQDIYQKVNRPHPNLDLSTVMDGLRAFRREYGGQLYLEVLLVAGINDQAEHLISIRKLIDELRPDEVELNTVVRPPADHEVRGLTPQKMQHAARHFPPKITKVIGHFSGCPQDKKDAILSQRVLELVKRRPCTATEMAGSLAVSLDEVHKTLVALQQNHELTRHSFGGQEYYCVPHPDVPEGCAAH